jgi:hypothetical protein
LASINASLGTKGVSLHKAQRGHSSKVRVSAAGVRSFIADQVAKGALPKARQHLSINTQWKRQPVFD